MFEAIILGIVQGVAEWLPVSSEGLIFLIKTNFFSGSAIAETLKLALFLHLGTFLAALVYFRREVVEILKTLFQYRKAEEKDKKILNFLIVSTLISSMFGLGLYSLADQLETTQIGARIITLIIGILLLFTAYLQFRTKKQENIKLKGYRNLNYKDGIILGFTQAAAAFPGLSRSGLTVSALLLRKFQEDKALRLSFLMSLPIVLGGNIVLNADKLVLSGPHFFSLFFSFLFGLLTIDFLLKIAQKFNFAWFVFGFGILTLLSVFLI